MITLIITIVLLILIIGFYNSLITKRNQTENAFASIDVMLKKRFDLIPNLVATVKQYSKHEQETFSEIIRLRNLNYSEMSETDKHTFDQTFEKASRNFVVLAESYPELKASENFLQLQRALNETEEQLSAARRTYNAAVTDYNNSVQSFPSNILARTFGFTRKNVYSISENERQVTDVKKILTSDPDE